MKTLSQLFNKEDINEFIGIVLNDIKDGKLNLIETMEYLECTAGIKYFGWNDIDEEGCIFEVSNGEEKFKFLVYWNWTDEDEKQFEATTKYVNYIDYTSKREELMMYKPIVKMEILR